MQNGGEAVRLAEIPGRGRSLLSAREIRGGEVVLRDFPILLYSAYPLISQSPYCDNCFRLLSLANTSTSVLACDSCTLARFCSKSCLASQSHSRWCCRALALASNTVARLSPDLQIQFRFLVASYNLLSVSPSNFQLLLSLQGTGAPNDDVRLLHSLIPPLDSVPPISLELAASLLAKDRLNAFGLMEPFDERKAGERTVRAYGIYPRAALFNHDCLPNACRFDYVDANTEGSNTEIVVRMIHDVPEGREVCLSYFPVNLPFAERQQRLLEDYGFRCDCDRCKVESSWSDHENNDEDAMTPDSGEEEEEMREMDCEETISNDDANGGGVGDDADFPHAYFFVRFVCRVDHCWGTLAPLPPAASQDSFLECNVCGNITKDDVV